MSTAEHSTDQKKPSRAFAALARRLLRDRQAIATEQNCSQGDALRQARDGLVQYLYLDAAAKGGIMAVGAGTLLLSGWGVVEAFTGLVFAGMGCVAVRNSLRGARMVQDAYQLYNNMRPGEFAQYINGAQP